MEKQTYNSDSPNQIIYRSKLPNKKLSEDCAIAGPESGEKPFSVAECIQLRQVESSILFLMEFANSHRQWFRYEEAEIPLKIALSIGETTTETPSPVVVKVLFELGELSEARRCYNSALYYYLRALKTADRVGGLDEFFVPRIYRTISGLFLKQGRELLAQRFARKAVSYCEQMWGLNNEETASSLAYYGALLFQRKRYQRAFWYLTRALVSYEKCPGSRETALADVLDLLADVSERTCDPSLSMAFQTRSRKVRGETSLKD